jgi:histidine triad (HIT) family protein
MVKSECVFCNFKDKEVFIYQDKSCYAIISKSPINRYHVLVIPRKHYRDFIDIPDKLAAHIFLVTKKLSSAVRKACKPDAITHMSDDDISGSGLNLVSHYKIHIIPRFKKEKLKIEWNREPDPGVEMRSKFAKTIKKHLK